VFSTIRPPAQRLLVFARLPELGRVKTRLAEAIGTERALAAYEAMVGDLLASIGESNEQVEIEILWAPTATANGAMLHRAFGDRSLAMQTGSDLGDRLAMAFSERFFFHRTQKIVAIGVDDPLLPRAIIDDAFALLESCDWVLGPADDGGYYLIGCRAAVFNAAIFRNVPWGSNHVFELTLTRIREMRNTVSMLPRRYDIDVVDDLQRFARDHAHDESELARLLRDWGMAA